VTVGGQVNYSGI